MNFEEVNSELLPMGVRLWNCTHGGYTWVIIHESGEGLQHDPETADWIGYSASYRQAHIQRLPILDGRLGADVIKVEDGRRFATYAEAEAACHKTLRAILAAH